MNKYCLSVAYINICTAPIGRSRTISGIGAVGICSCTYQRVIAAIVRRRQFNSTAFQGTKTASELGSWTMESINQMSEFV